MIFSLFFNNTAAGPACKRDDSVKSKKEPLAAAGNRHNENPSEPYCAVTALIVKPNSPDLPVISSAAGNLTPAEISQSSRFRRHSDASAWTDLTIQQILQGSDRRHIFNGVFSFGQGASAQFPNNNHIQATRVPLWVAQSLDTKLDDVVGNTGNIHSSAAYDGSETLITGYWRI
nr:hypothetical protein [Deltaproteobacteria bacterium]